MNSNKLITAGLLAAGLVSSAYASSSLNGTNIVYITGSTAFRAILWKTAQTIGAVGAPTVFDNGTTFSSQVKGANFVAGIGNVGSSTSAYNLSGVIGGQPTILSVALTGSEAGIFAVTREPAQEGLVTYAVPGQAWGAGKNPDGNANGVGGNVQLAGTPNPAFIDPVLNTQTVTSQQADLAFADTSYAVSLSAALVSAPNTPLTDFGIVGVIPFTWAKGTNSNPTPAWSHLVNVTHPQLQKELNTAQHASWFTSQAADTAKVYLIGRNKGSGTRVNTLLDLLQPTGFGVHQYAPANSSYNGYIAGAPQYVLTVGAAEDLLAAGGLAGVVNDGFDSGGGVAGTLLDDLANEPNDITLGYLGVADAITIGNGTSYWLTLDCVAESDATVEDGEYTFWGHEHFYGYPGMATGTPEYAVALALAGTPTVGTAPNQTYNENLENWVAPNGALEANGGIGTGVTAPDGAPFPNNSIVIDGGAMHVDKASGGDTGYPSPN